MVSQELFSLDFAPFYMDFAPFRSGNNSGISQLYSKQYSKSLTDTARHESSLEDIPHYST
jgi:hypothetical protein